MNYIGLTLSSGLTGTRQGFKVSATLVTGILKIHLYFLLRKSSCLGIDFLVFIEVYIISTFTGFYTNISI